MDGMTDDQEHLGLALAVLRSSLRLDQAEVARAAGVPASSVSEYENGKATPLPRTLDRILSGLGVPPSALEAAFGLIRLVQTDRDGASVIAASSRLSEATRNLAESLAVELFQPMARQGLGEPAANAQSLWERLRRYGQAERKAVLRECPEFQSVALCAFLCEESVKAAADKPERAEELAELALMVASLVPGGERRQSRVQGYALAFAGNARRVRGDLPGADEAFVRSAELWAAGSSAGLELLNPIRLLDLKASLLRDQRRLGESLELLDRALSLGGDRAARLLVKKAKTLEEMNDYEGAVEALRQAAPYLEDEKDPRLLLCQRFNLLENLFQTGRLAEAAPMLPGVRELTARLGNELDLVRLRWLEGRLAAGCGRMTESLEAFRWVRDEFIARGIAYDAALVTLEAAVLLADEGRAQEVKRLAGEAVPIFAAQGVGREALATLRLFTQAAEAETLTGVLARQLLAKLRGSSAALGDGVPP